PPDTPLCPYTTLFRSVRPRGRQLRAVRTVREIEERRGAAARQLVPEQRVLERSLEIDDRDQAAVPDRQAVPVRMPGELAPHRRADRKSTRLNSSHVKI